MKIPIIFISFAFCESIKLLILYEKQVERTVGETYKLILRQHVINLNRVLIKYQLRVELENVLAHGEYVDIDEYYPLSKFAGTDNVSDRIKAMEKFGKGKHVLLAISARTEDELTDLNEVSPCESKFIINLDSQRNSETEALSNIINAYLDLISKILGFTVPNLLEDSSPSIMRQIGEKMSRSDIVKQIKKCHADDQIENIESIWDHEKMKLKNNKLIKKESLLKKIYEVFKTELKNEKDDYSEGEEKDSEDKKIEGENKQKSKKENKGESKEENKKENKEENKNDNKLNEKNDKKNSKLFPSADADINDRLKDIEDSLKHLMESLSEKRTQINTHEHARALPLFRRKRRIGGYTRNNGDEPPTNDTLSYGIGIKNNSDS
ncbi:hypothetical protein TCON_1192 [Astathelohania contejeani]|uniref:Uncharacterized protein n=1 Tax=Astathelohania contejeani TaxID=164912 RepID=A0ABQ7HZH9_9MICR|nr:hypothetical protein TCON_1192 [Thelohania contejeani]